MHRCNTPGVAVILLATFIMTSLAQSDAGDNANQNAAEPPATEHQAYTQIIPGTDVTFDMMPIPVGVFKMGSPADEEHRKEDEGPQFEVEVDAFWMGRYEVTWEVYEKFLDKYYDEVIGPEKKRVLEKRNDDQADAVSVPSPMWEQDLAPMLEEMGRGGACPAAFMRQFAAKQFTKWLSLKTGQFYRLPTEAEWEYACRAGTTTAFNFGNDIAKLDRHAIHWENSENDESTAAYRKVGTHGPPNAWGLYDMHGNVAEWVLDAHEEKHYSKLANKRVTWKQAINWPTKEYGRIVRGGSYDSDPEDCRSAARVASNPNWMKIDCNVPRSAFWLAGRYDVGIRLVRPVKRPPRAEWGRYWEADCDATREQLDRVHYKLITVTPPDDPSKWIKPLNREANMQSDPHAQHERRVE